jgi:hypothetical protein
MISERLSSKSAFLNAWLNILQQQFCNGQPRLLLLYHNTVTNISNTLDSIEISFHHSFPLYVNVLIILIKLKTRSGKSTSIKDQNWLNKHYT